MTQPILTNHSPYLGVSFSVQSIPINLNFAIKLDENSYLIWRQQQKHVIRIYGLQGFVYGSSISPPRFIKKTVQVTTEEVTRIQEVIKVNSEFDVWNTKDNIVMSWIYSSIFQNYLKYLIGKDKDSTASYWKGLKKAFSDSSQAQMMQLRWRLQILQKGSMPVKSYIGQDQYSQNQNQNRGDSGSSRNGKINNCIYKGTCQICKKQIFTPLIILVIIMVIQKIHKPIFHKFRIMINMKAMSIIFKICH